MNFFDKALNFYINSSLHVALAVVSFVGITSLDYGLEIENWTIVFVFFSTIVAYTFVKYIPLVYKKKLNLSRSLQFVLLLAFLSIGPVLASLFYFKLEVILFIFLLGLFTVLYVIPFLPKAKNLRDVSGLKIFIIALVWTGTTVLLPLLSSGHLDEILSLKSLYYVVSRFCVIIVLIIPFEIRDLKLDNLYLKTLPQILGIKKTKAMGCGFVLVSALLLYNSIDSYTYIWIHIVIIYLILSSKKQNAFYFTALWVESVPILWLLLKYLSI